MLSQQAGARPCAAGGSRWKCTSFHILTPWLASGQFGVPTAATVRNSEPLSLSTACPLHPHAQVSTLPAAALRYHHAVSQTCSPGGQGLQQCVKLLRLQFLSPNASSWKVRDLDTALFSFQLMEGDRNSWAQRWSSRWTSLLSKGVCPPPTGTSVGWH